MGHSRAFPSALPQDDLRSAADAAARAEAPLPEGMFFDGSHYVRWDGPPLKWHPDMETFLGWMRDEKAAAVAAANREVATAREKVAATMIVRAVVP